MGNTFNNKNLELKNIIIEQQKKQIDFLKSKYESLNRIIDTF